MKPLILIADDSQAIAKVISMFLHTDYYTQHARNGSELITMLNVAKELPSLIISDVNMPMMDGYVVLKALKKDIRLRNIPVLMLSSIESTADRIKLLELGADDFMLKPFNPEELKIRIQRLIAARS